MSKKTGESTRLLPPTTNFDLKSDGLGRDDVGESTGIISSHRIFEGTRTEPLVPPVYHAATYMTQKVEDLYEAIKDGGAIYSRLGNPTTEEVDAVINVIEKGAGSLTFSSGMAAISSVLLGFLGKGDHVIIQIPCYPGTLTVLHHMEKNFGLELTKVRDAVFDDVVKAVRPNTKMLWIETPCNPEIVIVDIKRMTDMAKSRGILVAVDGTFASPLSQKAMQLGVDFSVHSCTKYMGGHSDLLAGCVTTATVEQWRKLRNVQTYFGNILSPQGSSLLHRSLKTLPIRMERHSQVAQKVAEFLEGHPKVHRVSYPGLPSHPQHDIAKRQMSHMGGMIMFDLAGGETAGKIVAESVHVIKMAVSLGGVESLLEHPYSMTHGDFAMTSEERLESGVLPGMLRLSVGLEDAKDLILDLEQALGKC